MSSFDLIRCRIKGRLCNRSCSLSSVATTGCLLSRISKTARLRCSTVAATASSTSTSNSSSRATTRSPICSTRSPVCQNQSREDPALLAEGSSSKSPRTSSQFQTRWLPQSRPRPQILWTFKSASSGQTASTKSESACTTM